MTFRKLVAVIMKMNKSLSKFPGATDNDKFSTNDLLEILEWSLPAKWQANFDLDRYACSLHDKARLIAEAEAIERAEDALPSSEKSKSETKNSHKKGKVFTKAQKTKTDKPGNECFCSEHGKNGTHTTADCCTIKNRANKANFSPSSSNKTFMKKFCDKINLLSKGKNKVKVLNLYAAEIKRERAKIQKNKAKSKAKAKKQAESSDDSSSEDDSDKEIVNIESPMRKHNEQAQLIH
jgi:hypothetical protein